MVKCITCGSEEVVSVLLRAETAALPVCEKHKEPCDECLRVEDLLRRLKKASRWSEAKSIDAAACGTRRDFAAADDAENMESLVFEAIVQELEKRIADAGKR